MLKRFFLFFAFFVNVTVCAWAQKNITGTVKDANTQEPIIGAAVMLKGTTIGGITDFDGNFSLKATEDAIELEVSYMGYISQTIALDGKTEFAIELKEDMVELEQVVVIGYGVQKKSDLTGAVSSVNSDDIRDMPTTNVVQAIQGKAAGVEVVQNSGSPGAETSIHIRGAGTVNDSDPLYIVDGIPMESINFLLPTTLHPWKY